MSNREKGLTGSGGVLDSYITSPFLIIIEMEAARDERDIKECVALGEG